MEGIRYKHDCINCEFLGQYKEYDLYVCNVYADTLCFSARFGDELAEEVVSTQTKIERFHRRNMKELDQLEIAYQRAKEKGLL